MTQQTPASVPVSDGAEPAPVAPLAVTSSAESRVPACIRCGGDDDLMDRGMAPGMTYCAPCRKAMSEPTTAAWTERMLLDRLHVRLSKSRPGNGPEWVYAEHVRSSSGFDVLNTIDALAMHLWRSRHHEVHAFEVKVSRADFRRELENDCAKSHIWRQWVEKFWIVAPRDVVPVEELPDEWGLLVTHGDGLRVRKPAKRLRPAPIGYMPAADIPRDSVAPFLRAAFRTAERLADPSRFVPDQEWAISDFMDDEEAVNG